MSVQDNFVKYEDNRSFLVVKALLFEQVEIVLCIFRWFFPMRVNLIKLSVLRVYYDFHRPDLCSQNFCMNAVQEQ